MKLIVDNEARAQDEGALCNEDLFREVNEKIVRLNQVFDFADGIFLCECSQSDCAVRLPLSLDEYETVRSDPRRFVMAPGHERPGARVIARCERYEVVESQVLRPRPELSLVLH